MTPDMTFQDITHFLTESQISPEGVIGCSEGDMEQVRIRYECPQLPKEYAAFLSEMGRGAGRFLKGSDVFFPDCLDNLEIARELLKEDSDEFGRDIELPRDAIVFLVHQGYEFYSLHPSPDGLERLHYYREGEGQFRDLDCTLRSFLKKAAQTAAKHVASGLINDN